MTDRGRPGHAGGVLALMADPRGLVALDERAHEGSGVRLRFEVVYEQHFDFVWRSVRRLGVPVSSVDDAVQDVFLVVHRRLGDFEGRSSVKTWLFGIALRVARDHRRAAARRPAEPLRESLSSTTACGTAAGCSPADQAAKREAAALLCALLDELDDDKRAVFVLAELEQMAAPEIAEALGVGVNTVYSRLRLARASFDAAVARHAAKDAWRLR